MNRFQCAELSLNGEGCGDGDQRAPPEWMIAPSRRLWPGGGVLFLEEVGGELVMRCDCGDGGFGAWLMEVAGGLCSMEILRGELEKGIPGEFLDGVEKL